MAEHYQSVDSTSNKIMNDISDAGEGVSSDFLVDISSKVKDISTLVTRARLKAKEAEIRAMYSLQFAERAVEEAKSAHVVSESLARTSQVVAMLALQITKDTDYLVDNTSFNDESYMLADDTTLISTANRQTDDKDSVSWENSSQNLQIQNFEGNTVDRYTAVHENFLKYQAIYPQDLRTDDMKNDHHFVDRLPLLSEEEVMQSEYTDLQGDTTDDVKRRMMIYQDSKLVKSNLKKKSLEMGDSGNSV